MTLLPSLLLPLLLLLLLLCASSFSLTLQPADGTLRGWRIRDVALLANTDMAYVLDRPRFIHAVNSSSGMVLPQSTSIDNDGAIVAFAANGFFASQRVYALIETYDFSVSFDISYWLVTMTADLQLIGNMSLAGLESGPTTEQVR